MTNKAAFYNYTIKYQIGGNGQSRQTKPMPRMLIISSIPDDHTVTIHKVENGQPSFRVRGSFELPQFAEFDSEEIVLGGANAGIPRFTMPDFAINRICDPDDNRKGLEQAQQVIEQYKIPVLNHPGRVLATRRDALYQRFADYKGIVVPKTLCIAPRYCRDVRRILEQGEIRLPCIFRPAGGHNSQNMYLINELDDVNELERFAFDGRNYYISEFHDCRDNDGLYRKFRVIYVDGKIYPRHLFVSENWCVSGKTKFAEGEYLDEEKRFLEDPNSYLGEETMAGLNKFCDEIGLDFFGLDLNLRPDGTLILFEANACMAAFLRPNREYLKPYVNAVYSATRDMLLRFYQTVKAGT
jgi:glutathione synthase/RimK-type ligase-like ATP-grasp enzyme